MDVNTIFRDTADGGVTVVRTQDVEAVIKACHEERLTAPSKHGHAAWRKIGSIPLVIAEQWSSECGASIGTREFAAYAKKKLMDGEFAKFRIRSS